MADYRISIQNMSDKTLRFYPQQRRTTDWDLLDKILGWGDWECYGYHGGRDEDFPFVDEVGDYYIETKEAAKKWLDTQNRKKLGNHIVYTSKEIDDFISAQPK